MVLPPCERPEWSNFTKFCAQNFELQGLTTLIYFNRPDDGRLEVLDGLLHITSLGRFLKNMFAVKVNGQEEIRTLANNADKPVSSMTHKTIFPYFSRFAI